MKKNILIGALLALTSLNVHAQDNCAFPMTILIAENVADFSPSAQAQLESKMRQIVTQNGMSGGVKFSNFCIVANLIEGTKNLTSGLRPLVTVSVDLTISIGNSFTGDRFASTAITLNGAGPNESRAYTAALASVNANNPQLQQFMKNTKKKIINYYETQTGNIIRKAKTLAGQQNFEEALYLLTSIPTCINKYDDVERATLSIFQSYLDLDCTAKINKAKAIWAASQDREGAKLAGAYIAAINPASTCTDDAQYLIDVINQRIGEEWEWAKDLKEFGKEMARSSVELEKMRIEAARAIGVAWAENQQPHTLIQSQVMESSKGGQQVATPRGGQDSPQQ